MIDQDKLNTLLRDIEPYYKLSHDEVGESLELMCRLCGYQSYISEALLAHRIVDIKRNLDWFKGHTKIVTKTATRSQCYQELEYDV